MKQRRHSGALAKRANPESSHSNSRRVSGFRIAAEAASGMTVNRP
jgi:hypothetical protein